MDPVTLFLRGGAQGGCDPGLVWSDAGVSGSAVPVSTESWEALAASLAFFFSATFRQNICALRCLAFNGGASSSAMAGRGTVLGLPAGRWPGGLAAVTAGACAGGGTDSGAGVPAAASGAVAAASAAWGLGVGRCTLPLCFQ